jgi:hypothetical protein
MYAYCRNQVRCDTEPASRYRLVGGKAELVVAKDNVRRVAG